MPRGRPPTRPWADRLSAEWRGAPPPRTCPRRTVLRHARPALALPRAPALPHAPTEIHAHADIRVHADRQALSNPPQDRKSSGRRHVGRAARAARSSRSAQRRAAPPPTPTRIFAFTQSGKHSPVRGKTENPHVGRRAGARARGHETHRGPRRAHTRRDGLASTSRTAPASADITCSGSMRRAASTASTDRR